MTKRNVLALTGVFFQVLTLCAMWAVASPAGLRVARPIDSEWPPEADPINNQMSPGANLEMGLISVSIPNEFADWFAHQHDVGGWNEWPLDFAIGDIEGIDDGDVDIVLSMANEIMLGARLTIDVDAGTATLEPLWCWKVPGAPATPPSNHAGHDAHNCLIWDFDGDGANEVAIVAPAQYELWGELVWGQAIYVVQTDSSPPPAPWDFSVPPPRVLAQSEASSDASSGEIAERLGICRVSDTPYRQEIVSHNHDGSTLSIWRMPPQGSPIPGALERVFSRSWTVPVTHEFNHADIDGDGFDEFAWDGVLDFVDLVGGVATPTNATDPLQGVWLWKTGMVQYAHMDQMMILDFDPASPGLEINSTPEFDWTDPTGATHRGVDTLWKTDGTILRVNDDCPFHHPQGIHVGNWTASRDGLESIFVPKSFGAPTVTGGEIWLCGAYAVDAQQNELAVDGGYWQTVKVNPPENDLPIHRATGPAYRMSQIDWDGNRESDEILNYFWQTMIIWRMGEKGDWGDTPPAGMPTQAQLQEPWIEDGNELWWEFYQGYNGQKINEWSWNNGGPGRYTHYYEKLGEAYPGGGVWRPLAWDILGDSREEAVVVTRNKINIFFNRDLPPTGIAATSPTADRTYRRVRMERVGEPYMFEVGNDTPCPADFNNDRQVNGADLAMLLASWGATDPDSRIDLDHNGVIDGADLAVFLGAWGSCDT